MVDFFARIELRSDRSGGPTINIEIVAADVRQDEVDATGDFVTRSELSQLSVSVTAEAAGKLVVLKKGEMADRAAVLEDRT